MSSEGLKSEVQGIHEKLAEIADLTVEGSEEKLEEVTAACYAYLVDHGLHEIPTVFASDELSWGFHEATIELNTALYQSGRDVTRSERYPKNYPIQSQNLLMLNMAIRLMEDEDVTEEAKKELCGYALFSPFGTSVWMQLFPYTENDREYNVNVEIVNSIAVKLEALAESSDVFVSKWAGKLLLGVKEGYFNLNKSRDRSSGSGHSVIMNTEPVVQLSESEVSFFKMDYTQRAAHLLRLNLMKRYDSEDKTLPAWVADYTLDMIRGLMNPEAHKREEYKAKLEVLQEFLLRHGAEDGFSIAMIKAIVEMKA